jgi:hypothetical protein
MSILSYYNTGSPDLDTRPPQMLRSTLSHWVQLCPHCRYVAADISKGTDVTAAIVRSDAYQTQLSDELFSELANLFLCCALIQERHDDVIGAGWSSVQAAWASDDDENAAAAIRCRRRAIDLFKAGMKHGLPISEQQYAEFPLLADLSRRAGDFEVALEVCRDGLRTITQTSHPERGADASEGNTFIEQLLRYQASLVERGDTAAHTIEEALGSAA